MATKDKKNKKSKEKMPFKERMRRHLDIPPDAFYGRQLLEIRGKTALTFRGGEKILTYTPKEIRISTKDGALCVWGEDLECTSYYVGAIGIDGKIKGICFEEDSE